MFLRRGRGRYSKALVNSLPHYLGVRHRLPKTFSQKPPLTQDDSSRTLPRLLLGVWPQGISFRTGVTRFLMGFMSGVKSEARYLGPALLVSGLLALAAALRH